MYAPDRWVMLKITHQGNIQYRVLGTWVGGYAVADSWRLNSGCTKIVDDGDVYKIHGVSGSIYVCPKNSYGLSTLGSSVLGKLKLDMLTYGSTIEVLPESTDFIDLLWTGK